MHITELPWEVSEIVTNNCGAFPMCWDLSKYFIWTSIIIVALLWLLLLIINSIHILCFSVFINSLRSLQGPLTWKKEREMLNFSVIFLRSFSAKFFKMFCNLKNLNRKWLFFIISSLLKHEVRSEISAHSFNSPCQLNYHYHLLSFLPIRPSAHQSIHLFIRSLTPQICFWAPLQCQ